MSPKVSRWILRAGGRDSVLYKVSDYYSSRTRAGSPLVGSRLAIPWPDLAARSSFSDKDKKVIPF